MSTSTPADPTSSAESAADTQGTPEHVDVVVVGAGLSGVGAAYRLQTERPGTTYAILEARDDLGGTWDLFRYPGVRSDSDMYTLGYGFKPWKDGRSLADGASILDYIRETADEFGIERHIRYASKVVGADFDTAAARWTLTLEDTHSGERRTMTCGFLYSCAGYYDYDNPHDPVFEGTESFAGEVVHPQFWPEDLDYAGKRVVVIGSGATAVTLVPSMLKGEGAAAHVTMLQRTPTWISAVPSRDKKADRIKAVLPEGVAHHVVRAKNIAFSTAFYQFCRRRPATARKLLTGMATKILGDEQLVADHFTPPYDPWDQRLCAIPSGDLFRAIKAGDADVVTNHVDRLVPEGVRLRSGEVIEADVVVTATGLRLLAFGGIEPYVDGHRVELSEEFVWNGAMMTGVPNFAVCIGYTNASWTLRADLTHRLVCKVLGWMEKRGHDVVAPRPDGDLEPQPLLDLAAGYVQRSIGSFPRQGDRRPWQVRQNYVLDSLHTLRTDLDRTLAPVTAATPVTDDGALVGADA
ncbi:flavin-containing monooxygenase [Nocardioides alkalitolerans]|uniref:flavin-containing monooxygenase n=1 Tax=Nocardioides alkalitolerans TaxID=281714 RepID=UPI000693BE64|nr:NAD(P)/FAD-dependent oxidoreductase [Nocardioides alkalitolerans]